MEKSDLIRFFKEKRKDFPILNIKIHGKALVYVDNSATTQKPKVMIDSLSNYYTFFNSNIHRGIHTLSEKATQEYENVREKVARFINCDEKEVVFTKGTTESLNIVAFGLEDDINEGDEIVLSQMEHHANLVPWQEVARRKKATLKFIPYTKDFYLDVEKARELITSKTKIVSVTHCSNVLGTINPVKELAEFAHNVGALFVLDGAQSVPHMKIDVKELNCDLLGFSAHKMAGPTGVGVLYGKKEVLEKLRPYQYGGDMIYEVTFTCSTYNEIPYRLEAGTPNIADVIVFGKTLDYLEEIGMEKIEQYEKVLCDYFLQKVKEVEDLVLYGPYSCEKREGVFSFNMKGVHPHDIGTILDRQGIAIRGGHHCAMPLVTLLGTSATSRISFYFYNTLEEIDFIIEVLKKVKEIYAKGEFLL